MAFKVEKMPTAERYCPNGHKLPEQWPENDYAVKFCHICGAPIEEHQTTYDAALCVNCNSLVDPSWNYCPNCGQGSE